MISGRYNDRRYYLVHRDLKMESILVKSSDINEANEMKLNMKPPAGRSVSPVSNSKQECEEKKGELNKSSVHSAQTLGNKNILKSAVSLRTKKKS